MQEGIISMSVCERAREKRLHIHIQRLLTTIETNQVIVNSCYRRQCNALHSLKVLYPFYNWTLKILKID